MSKSPSNLDEDQKQKLESSSPRATETAAPPPVKHLDPLNCDDDEDEAYMPPSTREVRITTATPSQVQLRKVEQEPPHEVQIPREMKANMDDLEPPPVPVSVLAITPTRSNDSQNVSANASQKKVSFSTLNLSDSRSANDTSGAEINKKAGITVEVTTDGVLHSEELDPRELARLYAQQQAALRSIRGEFDILYVPDWVRLHPLLGSYVAEAFGTFACVLTLSLVSVRNQSIFDTKDETNMTSLPIGFMFMCMVFTFGYISGGHFNPAVTIAVFLVRKIDVMRTFAYLVCQTGAALGAGLVAMAIQGSTEVFVPKVDPLYVSSGIFSELIYTFAIATVVLNVAYSRQSGNFFYGFAIGMTIAAGSAAVGRISGGAFNPAAATGLQLALCLTGDCDPLASFWVYWMAPLVGSVLASILYSQITQPEDTHALTDAEVLQTNEPPREENQLA
ncbi:aquaporin-like protein [Trypanosoma theileri]|uniref:Aquaporin-like protein n=1 Tax=Trypanosoma theileri TaxID=67003 RepID=A0A1X0NRT6_9TRYP|nr:aquaporin-like protein [Trypanosoma theileri]ORC87311.1 aquaporin-like protein [Trypanosoma theileri]